MKQSVLKFHDAMMLVSYKRSNSYISELSSSAAASSFGFCLGASLGCNK